MKRNVVLIALVVGLLALMVGVAYAATLTPQTISTSGLIVTPEAAPGTSNEFANDGKQVIYLNNGSGGTLYYTVTVPAKVGGFDLTDLTGSVANGVAKYIGPFNPTYVNAADGHVDFALSTVSSVDVAILSLD